MTFNSIWDALLFPGLAGIIVLYFAIRALVFHDASILVGKNAEVTKDVEGYTKTAGIYTLLFACSMVVYGVILYYSPVFAIVFAVLTIITIIILWRNLNRKHGVKKIS